jgi:MOSC domain-containing protein YiiM
MWAASRPRETRPFRTCYDSSVRPNVVCPMEELPQVAALEEVGFENCAHAQPGGKRQVLLVDRETLDALELGPGMIRENITTEGLNVNGLKLGESSEWAGCCSK